MPETIRWTVLPDGTTADGKLRLTVLVSPRLTGGDTLRSFPGFKDDWPKTLRGYASALQVEFQSPGGTSVTVPTEPQTDRYPPADSGLWPKLFGPDTKVSPPPGALAAAPAGPPTLRSFPSRAVHEQITALYEAAATATAHRRAFPATGSDPRLGAAATGEIGLTTGASDTGAPAAGVPAAGAPIAEAPASWDHPRTDDLTGNLTPAVRSFSSGVATLYGRLDRLLQGTSGGGGPHAAAAPDPYRPLCMDRTRPEYKGDRALLGLAETYRFYDRATPAKPAVPPARQTGDTPAAPLPPPTAPDLDFHAACALLADYPELLRRFGLALDLLVTPPPGLADQWQARVSFTAPQEQLNADKKLRPWTLLRHVPGKRFEAYAADDGLHGHRMLKLGVDEVHTLDLDVDGAAMKYVEFSRIVDQVLTDVGDPGTAASGDPTALPALHGAGLTVLYEGRDASLADQMAADAHHTAGVGPDGRPVEAAVLDAAHLVRGYRVDVGVVDAATGRVTTWYPLCARTGDYAIRPPGKPPVPITADPDEGHVKATAVTGDKTGANQLFVHQALFGWHGWSLAAPPPGRTIGADNEPHVPDPEVSAAFPLDASFRPTAGTLPALRYRRTYRLRARLVDLAGNSLAPGAPAVEGTATDPVTYARWEPVPPPAIVPKWPFLEGESEPRLVIRSTVDEHGVPMSPLEWSVRRNGEVPDHGPGDPLEGPDRRYRSFDERHVSPPKTALLMAEQHGQYDGAFGPGKSADVRSAYFAAASRESGTYLDTVVRLAEDPRITRDLKAAHAIHVVKHNPHDTSALTPLPVARGSGLKQGEYVIHSADQLLLPYLPDVLARGVSLRGLPGARPNETYEFTGPWPQARPLRLRIEEGNGPPSSGAGGVVTVFLPKGETATVRMSCRVDAADLDLFRAWRILTGSALWNDPVRLPQPKKEELTAAAAAGENWMITPWVDVTLVHAVERPLEPPVLGDLTFSRLPGQTFASLSGPLRSHAKSTGRIDLDATWTEWHDDVTEPEPRQITGHDHVGEITVEPFENDIRIGDFGGPTVRHEFRDTRHRNVTYTPTAATRFREYFHPAITDRTELITSRGPGSAGPSDNGWAVPSTRRPEPPVISHVVPTFGRQRTVDHGLHRVTRARRHAGVRVYLKRPWFSSGDDELLAVVLDPGSRLPAELVTRCGNDPVWADDAVLPRLRPGNFPNARGTATGVLAEQAGEAPVTVPLALFQPVFDRRLGLWACDIDVDLGDLADSPAYFPYVRLALARYQPCSLDPLHMSKVVLAEFVQLMPDRTVTATMAATGNQIRLELTGPAAPNALGALAGTGQAAMAASRRVLATVQKRAHGAGDLEWAAAATALELTCTARGTGFAWTGDLTLPATALFTDYRLLIEEHETYLTDRATATGTVTAGGAERPVARRIVHADYFGLTVSLLGRIVLEE
ncbi:hypothetical protein [Streptomyces nondiastaticus]|uniref:Baseplate protein J-like domain-containing protein n=1 Tax=Streptomyces nondiastaticus TaxID=3154512 RepID=A0ABW6U1Q2_9ACTN